jgi:hypothetical protein
MVYPNSNLAEEYSEDRLENKNTLIQKKIKGACERRLTNYFLLR